MILSRLLLSFVTISLLVGCSSKSDPSPEEAPSDGIPSRVRQAGPEAIERWNALSDKEKTQTREMFAYLEASWKAMGPSQTIKTTYRTVTPPTSVAAEKLAQTIKKVGRSLAFLDWSFRNDVRATIDLFAIPNGVLSDVQVDWTSVTDASGAELLKEADGQVVQSRNEGQWSQNLTLTAEGSKAIRAKGVMTLRVPVAFDTVTLTRQDIGKTKRSGSLAVTLRRMERNFVEFQATGTPKGADWQVIAWDGEHRALERSSSARRKGLYRANVRGTIDSVSLYVPRKIRAFQLKFIATAIPGKHPVGKYQKAFDLPARPRFLPDGPLPKLVAISESDAKQQIQIIAARGDALWTYNRPIIRTILPNVGNSAFCRVRLKSADLTTASGSPVNHATQSGLLTWGEGSWFKDSRINRPEGDDTKAPIEFARASGQIVMDYPLKMRWVTLTKTNPKSGPAQASFSGTRVRISGPVADADISDSKFASIRGYDSAGRRLASISGGFGSSTDFWGQPTKVRVAVVEESKPLTINFDLPPAKLLPAPTP